MHTSVLACAAAPDHADQWLGCGGVIPRLAIRRLDNGETSGLAFQACRRERNGRPLGTLDSFL